MSNELKAIYTIWLREIIRYWRNKTRAISGFGLPILWLVIMGSGLSSSLRFSPVGLNGGGLDYVNFLFPGILAMMLLISSMHSALTIVYDREFGFFKEIFVAPISRTSIVLGKILGGATTATAQASFMFVLTPFIGIKLSFATIPFLVLAMFFIAFGASALGVLIASRIKSTETFPIVMQLMTMPMFFLSGALFPLRGAPEWLVVLAKFDPLTYGVTILKSIFFSGAGITQASLQATNATIFGHALTLSLSMYILLGFSLAMVAISTWALKRTE